ncbi:MAG TPA: hypothetical protein VLW85_24795 [Myxococcales bacterium]|nr:hypothetical protein [Myxococcales bacterium]
MLAVAACARGPGSGQVSPNTMPTPQTHLFFPIASGPHAVDCNTCHGAFDSFKQFDCLGCHDAHDNKPVYDEVHGSLTAAAGLFLPDGGVGYSYDSASCLRCHATGEPVPFDHAGVKSSCATCHDTGAPFAAFPASGHVDRGGNDCTLCHVITSWSAAGYPGSLPVPASQVVVSEWTLSPIGGFVTSATRTTATLLNQMVHVSAQIPASMQPSNGGDCAKCAMCHGVTCNPAGTGFVGGSLAAGAFHASVTAQNQTLPGGCTDCHAQTRPAGIVQGQANGELQPIDHAAPFAGTSVGAFDCGTCHLHPDCKPAAGHSCWEDPSGDTRFHGNNGLTAATNADDCTACHFQLMADRASADKNSMLHGSAQMPFQACGKCHTGALAIAAARANAAALTAASFNPGAFHASIPAQPTACLACHAGSMPAAAHQSTTAYLLPAGSDSGTNARQWMSHASTSLGGLDCAACHLADAIPSGGTWTSSSKFHTNVASPDACQKCHGFGNGVSGVAAGNGNNMPEGLTNSSTVSSAASDPTTGIPPNTLDQVSHDDVAMQTLDCNACHQQQGVTWSQASFHAVVKSPTACAGCHANLKPTAAFPAFDHSGITKDCSACHSWPGEGSASSPNWLGGAPAMVTLNGFTSPSADITYGASIGGCAITQGSTVVNTPSAVSLQQGASITGTGIPAGDSVAATVANQTSFTLTAAASATNPAVTLKATNTVSFPHPSSGTYTSCAQCHAGTDYDHIIDYNHDGLTSSVSINGATLVTQPNLGSTVYGATSNPTFCVYCHLSGSPYVTQAGPSSINANTTSGSNTVTTSSTATLTQGMTVTGTGIPTGTKVTIQSIPSATSFVLSSAADATGATSLSVTHKSIDHQQEQDHDDHKNFVPGQDCTSCHVAPRGGGSEALTPPVPGVFGSGSIGGG